MKLITYEDKKVLSLIDENMKKYQEQKQLNQIYDTIFDKSNINKVSIIPTGSGILKKLDASFEEIFKEVNKNG